jgi:hypothetical protein
MDGGTMDDEPGAVIVPVPVPVVVVVAVVVVIEENPKRKQYVTIHPYAPVSFEEVNSIQ